MKGGVYILKHVFNRIEKKYILNEKEYEEISKKIIKYIKQDEYGEYTIQNIYFDNDNYDLIRLSTDKPQYKEKIRLRSYGIPTSTDRVFLEIKKKYKGIVNKRRATMNLNSFYELYDTDFEDCDKQILKEIKYIFDQKKITPKLFLAYDRVAFVSKEDNNFRITFDKNIRSRWNDLKLEKGDYGTNLFTENIYVMEVKCLGGLPLWFVKILTELKIYPKSFSKCGYVYKSMLTKKEELHV